MKAKTLFINFPVKLGPHAATGFFTSGSNRVADIDINEAKQTARVTDEQGHVVVVFMGGGGAYVPQPEEAKK